MAVVFITSPSGKAHGFSRGMKARHQFLENISCHLAGFVPSMKEQNMVFLLNQICGSKRNFSKENLSWVKFDGSLIWRFNRLLILSGLRLGLESLGHLSLEAPGFIRGSSHHIRNIDPQHHALSVVHSVLGDASIHIVGGLFFHKSAGVPVMAVQHLHQAPRRNLRPL